MTAKTKSKTKISSVHHGGEVTKKKHAVTEEENTNKNAKQQQQQQSSSMIVRESGGKGVGVVDAGGGVDINLLDRAMTALLKHHGETVKDKGGEKHQYQLLGTDKPVQVQFTLSRIPVNPSPKPVRIDIPHPVHKVPSSEGDSNSNNDLLVDDDNVEVCLIVKEESKPWVQDLITQFPTTHLSCIKKVLGLQSLRKKHNTYEQRRDLLRRYDIFMADDRILPMLAKCLGKNFFQEKKQPIPIKLSRKEALPFVIEKCLKGTYMYLSGGTCLTIRAGDTSMSHNKLTSNVDSIIQNATTKIPRKWANISSIGIKLSDSVMLPIYNKTREELLIIAKMAGLNDDEEEEELEDEGRKRKRWEESNDGDEEEGDKNKKRKELKAKSPLVRALKRQKEAEEKKEKEEAAAARKEKETAEEDGAAVSKTPSKKKKKKRMDDSEEGDDDAEKVGHKSEKKKRKKSDEKVKFKEGTTTGMDSETKAEKEKDDHPPEGTEEVGESFQTPGKNKKTDDSKDEETDKKSTTKSKKKKRKDSIDEAAEVEEKGATREELPFQTPKKSDKKKKKKKEESNKKGERVDATPVGKASLEEESGDDENSPFIPSKKYKGSKSGYVFRNGKDGVGYYVDVKPVVDKMVLEAFARLGGSHTPKSGRRKSKGGGGKTPKSSGRRKKGRQW